MMTWEEIDESDNPDIVEPSEGFIETWQPSTAQLNLVSLFRRHGEDLIDEIEQLTGCMLHVIPERRQVHVEGEDNETVKRTRKMLDALERHFVSHL